MTLEEYQIESARLNGLIMAKAWVLARYVIGGGVVTDDAQRKLAQEIVETVAKRDEICDSFYNFKRVCAPVSP